MNTGKSRMLKSPLLHFFVIAGIAYTGMIGVKNSGILSSLTLGEEMNLIALTQAELDQIYKEHGDKRSDKKLAASIDTLVDNELLFSEGLKLGLAANDALIIDRMVKNIEYVSQQQVIQEKCASVRCMGTKNDAVGNPLNEDSATLDAANIDESDLNELFAEARSLNLFENDPVIYRRVTQLAEQHLRQNGIIGKPLDDELRSYMRRNSADFQVPTRWTLEQIYFNPSLHADRFNAVLDHAFNELRNTTTVSNNLGDTTILPRHVVMATERQLVQQFGNHFAKSVSDAPLNKWMGPIESEFGTHFIRLSTKREQKIAALSDVYNRAFLGWLEERKRNAYQDQITALRESYTVSVAGYDTVSATEFSSYWMQQHHINQQLR